MNHRRWCYVTNLTSDAPMFQHLEQSRLYQTPHDRVIHNDSPCYNIPPALRGFASETAPAI